MEADNLQAELDIQRDVLKGLRKALRLNEEDIWEVTREISKLKRLAFIKGVELK